MHAPDHIGRIRADALAGRVAIVTGAGRGVGLETARALASLGARVAVAEIDPDTGAAAAEAIRDEHGHAAAVFVPTDVGDEDSLGEAVERVKADVGPIDIVVNNATVTPFGAVAEAPLADWDVSYRVNLRGPATLARLTVPAMVTQRRGAFVCLSSAGGAFMGPYEALKAAQVELASALAAELEGTGVSAFAIGPGQVMTPGLAAAVPVLAPLYGMTPDEFLAMSAEHSIPAEDAGAGIAAAIVLAERFHGTETSALAGLAAARILEPRLAEGAPPDSAPPETAAGTVIEAGGGATLPAGASALAREVRATFLGQVREWRARGAFERKWMERDFRRHTGMSPEESLAALDALIDALDRGSGIADGVVLSRLRGYYERYEQLARDNARDVEVLAKQLEAIEGWRREIERLKGMLRA